MTDNGKPLIFISYACEDEIIVKALSELIERTCSGVETWFSGDGRPGCGCPPGEHWFEVTHKKLENADFVLTLVTANSIDRPWIYWESGICYSKHNHSRVVPILLGLSFKDIVDPLKQLQGFDASKHDQLCDNLFKIAGKLNQKPHRKDLERNCEDFWQEIKDHIPIFIDNNQSIFSDRDVFPEQVLEEIASRLEKKITAKFDGKITSKQLDPESRGTQKPDPEIERAAEQATEIEKAGVTVSTDILRSLALKLYKSNDVEKALELQRLVAAALDASARDISNLGVIFNDMGEMKEAEEAYLRALKADPDLAPAWFNLANLLKKDGRKEESEEAYRKAIEIDPNHTSAWNNLAILLKKDGRIEEAEESYRKAIEIDPNHTSAWNNLASLLDNDGRKEEAEEAFRKAIEINPNNASVWNNLAGLLDNDGRKKEAEEAYRKVIEIDPNYANVWYNLAILLVNDGRKKEAERAYRKAIETNPKDSDLLNTFAYFLWEQERFEEAEVIVDKAIIIDSSCSYAYATKGLLLFEKNQLDEGREYYERAINLKPEDKELQQKYFYEYGRALNRNGKQVEARKYLLEAKNIDANFVPIEKIEAELAKLDSAG